MTAVAAIQCRGCAVSRDVFLQGNAHQDACLVSLAAAYTLLMQALKMARLAARLSTLNPTTLNPTFISQLQWW